MPRNAGMATHVSSTSPLVATSDARLQAIVVAPKHCDGCRCASRRLITKNCVRDDEESVVVVPVKGGVLGDIVGDEIRRAGWGVGSAMVDFLLGIFWMLWGGKKTLATHGLEKPFFQLCCCVSFLFWCGLTYYLCT